MEDELEWICPNLGYYPAICLKELRKTVNGFSQDSKSMGSDLNGGLPEYEERVKDFMFSLFA
jgi:hypothetical protein